VPGRKGGYGRKVVLSVSLGLCFGLFAGLGFYAVSLGTDRIFPADSENAVITELPDNMVNLPEKEKEAAEVSHVTYVVDDVSGMVEGVMPSMVSIVNNYVRTTSFWGQIYNEPWVSSGSGIIVGETDEELLIATNNHVVEKAKTLTVQFSDDSTAEATVRGTAPSNDLAVVSVHWRSPLLTTARRKP